MKRHLFNFAGAVSLVLCLGTAVCWIVSNHRPLAFEFVGRDGLLWEVAARNGRFSLDTYPQIRIDRLPTDYHISQFNKLVRVEQSMRQRYEQMFKSRQNKEISRATWDEFVLREYSPMQLDIEARKRRIASTLPRYPMLPSVAHSLKCGMVVLCSTVLPTIWTAFWFLPKSTKANRRAQNLCTTCGYNLTGNTSGICPECGEPVGNRTA